MATVTMTSINVKPRSRAELFIFLPRRVFGARPQALRHAVDRRSAQADRWSNGADIARHCTLVAEGVNRENRREACCPNCLRPSASIRRDTP